MSPDPSLADPPDLEDIELQLLLEAVNARWGYDFRGYLRTSVRRRARRLLQDRGESFAELQHAVLRDRETLAQLVDVFTIQVSDMFRDPPFWRAFADQVVPLLRTYPRASLWVAGCADGEELWSYAIMLAEHQLRSRVRLYGTDLNPRAIDRCRAGSWTPDRAKTFTTNWLATGASTPLHHYYEAAGGRVRFNPDLLADTVLATHDLVGDESFVEAQVISCRNVLIYFDAELRERSLSLFHRSMSPYGVLCLGSRETLGFSSLQNAFEALDAEQRIYRRTS